MPSIKLDQKTLSFSMLYSNATSNAKLSNVAQLPDLEYQNNIAAISNGLSHLGWA